MKVATVIVLSQVLGGFLAGIGGGIEMLGRYPTFSWSSLPGYGWTGITIAILAGNNPWFVPFASFFMAYLTKGCELMATYANVPCTSDCLLCKTSSAFSPEHFSTAPPPMVPTVCPSAKTAIFAPAPRGVEPDEARMLHSTTLCPSESACSMDVNSSFIVDPPS